LVRRGLEGWKECGRKEGSRTPRRRERERVMSNNTQESFSSVLVQKMNEGGLEI
jgi:hypothetical protein